jgi:hypothetical protein
MTMHRFISRTGMALAFMAGCDLAAAGSSSGLAPNAVALTGVPTTTTASAAFAKALVTTGLRKGAAPNQFAVSLPLDNAVSDGRWSLAGDLAIWQFQVVSPGAIAVSLELAATTLPAGARFWLLDATGGQARGPYTAADIASDGRFWTPLIRGDTVVVQAEVPVAQQGAFAVHIVAAHHAYRELGSGGIPTKAAGTSGSCEINIACPAGAAWQAESRAVAMITIGGNFECTGTLLNDVPQDNTPYLLTANHCGIGTVGEPASSVVAYWNYQAATCAGTSGSLSNAQTGATLLANDTQSDFALLRLNALPDASFGVYYAGWNVQGIAPQSGVTIHQPENDIKKISVYVTPATATQTLLGATLLDTAVWAVNWSQGVTEGGSSGSPLFDQSHAVVGQLAGGDSSCANPGGTDYYGRLAVSWNGNAASNAQLKPYLDPANSGTQVLCGRNAGDPACTVGGSSSGGSSTGASGGGTTGTSSGGGSTGTSGGGTTGTSGGSTGTAGGGSSSSGGGGAAAPAFLIPLALLALFRRRIAAGRTECSPTDRI